MNEEFIASYIEGDKGVYIRPIDSPEAEKAKEIMEAAAKTGLVETKTLRNIFFSNNPFPFIINAIDDLMFAEFEHFRDTNGAGEFTFKPIKDFGTEDCHLKYSPAPLESGHVEVPEELQKANFGYWEGILDIPTPFDKAQGFDEPIGAIMLARQPARFQGHYFPHGVAIAMFLNVDKTKGRWSNAMVRHHFRRSYKMFLEENNKWGKDKEAMGFYINSSLIAMQELQPLTTAK